MPDIFAGVDFAFTQRIQIRTWKVEIRLCEEDDVAKVHYFASKDLALLAIAWAYDVHVASLRARKDTTEIQEYPDLDDGSWKLKEMPGKKVTWWKKTLHGYVAMKDYFNATLDEFDRTVIGEAA